MNFIDFLIGLFIFLFVAPILNIIFSSKNDNSVKNQNQESDNSNSIFDNGLDSDSLDNSTADINPASGLQMMEGGIDIGGNAYGFNDD